jgi:hypothetical protein
MKPLKNTAIVEDSGPVGERNPSSEGFWDRLLDEYPYNQPHEGGRAKP